MSDYLPNGGGGNNQSPLCTPLAYIGNIAPENYVFLTGETLGNAASEAINADDGYETAFNMLVSVYPNLGTEDWQLAETVILPDMRGRFPIGLDEVSVDRINLASAKLLGGTAGSDEITIMQVNLPNISLNASLGGQHSHTGSTNSAGAHTHNVRWPGSGQGGWNIFNSSFSDTQWASGRVLSAGAHTHTVTVDLGGSHGHSVPLGGEDDPILTVPPFTAFNWIMRVK